MNLSLVFFIAFSVTFLCCLLILLTQTWHEKWTLDHQIGVQKFHIQATSRIGGLGLFLGLLSLTLNVSEPHQDLLIVLLLGAIPAVTLGIAEDLTRKVSPRVRLLGTLFGGVIACWLSGTTLTHLDVWGVDSLLAWPLVATLFTAFAIGGVTNAINIIDGFNGLAAGIVTLSLLAISFIAQLAGDTTLMQVCLMLCAVIAGFGILNFPYGKIFMGDGGAYMIGFCVAWLAVLLPMRNHSVSPWFSLVVCSYPVLEVLFSMARRKSRNLNLGDPDRLHLHSLIKTRIVQKHFYFLMPVWKNSFVSVLLWAYHSVFLVVAIVLYNSTLALMVLTAFSALAYWLIYSHLIRFARP
jgi:UDP-N-acetylmuramyl pentapeptide phosphotransferase/UDP-N-acetylglucosamine-1-phosphate transferase